MLLSMAHWVVYILLWASRLWWAMGITNTPSSFALASCSSAQVMVLSFSLPSTLLSGSYWQESSIRSQFLSSRA